MDTNAMKRMVVLKNLQSNIIDEAYVVFKNNVKVHKYEKIENEKRKSIQKEEKNYIIKEAEMVVNDYVSKIENKEICVNKQNYNRLKIITISFGIYSLLNFILILLK